MCGLVENLAFCLHWPSKNLTVSFGKFILFSVLFSVSLFIHCKNKSSIHKHVAALLNVGCRVSDKLLKGQLCPTFLEQCCHPADTADIIALWESIWRKQCAKQNKSISILSPKGKSKSLAAPVCRHQNERYAREYSRGRLLRHGHSVRFVRWGDFPNGVPGSVHRPARLVRWQWWTGKLVTEGKLCVCVFAVQWTVWFLTNWVRSSAFRTTTAKTLARNTPRHRTLPEDRTTVAASRTKRSAAKLLALTLADHFPRKIYFNSIPTLVWDVLDVLSLL